MQTIFYLFFSLIKTSPSAIYLSRYVANFMFLSKFTSFRPDPLHRGQNNKILLVDKLLVQNIHALLSSLSRQSVFDIPRAHVAQDVKLARESLIQIYDCSSRVHFIIIIKIILNIIKYSSRFKPHCQRQKVRYYNI